MQESYGLSNLKLAVRRTPGSPWVVEAVRSNQADSDWTTSLVLREQQSGTTVFILDGGGDLYSNGSTLRLARKWFAP